MVNCRKLGKMLPGLKRPPYRNELGQKLFDEVSQEAWDEWLKFSVRLINTRGVDLASAAGQKFMLDQTAVYFGYAEGDVAETAWTAPPAGGHDHGHDHGHAHAGADANKPGGKTSG